LYLVVFHARPGVSTCGQCPSHHGATRGKQGPIKVEIAQPGAERKLTLETQAGSRISATQDASGTFNGFFIARNGKSKKVTVQRMTEAQAAAAATTTTSSVVAATSGAVSGSANEPDLGFLSKAEMESLSTGKKWRFTRLSDGHQIVWDLRSGGALYGNNYTAIANGSGTWSLNEIGQVCVKWRDQSQDGCASLAKDGAKFKIFRTPNLKVLFATVTVE
jgi:hypothetical protein